MAHPGLQAFLPSCPTWEAIDDCGHPWSPSHASRSASPCCTPPSAVMIATRSAQASYTSSGTASVSPPATAAAGPTPAVYAKDRYHARATCSKQRQCIKGTFAHPQWAGIHLQRGGVQVAFLTRQMIVTLRLRDLRCSADRPAVEIHQAPVRCGMRKHHAAPAPITSGVRPGIWRCIAHTVLLGKCQRNAALLQVGFAATARQCCLKDRELLGEVRPGRCRRTRRRWACHGFARGGWMASASV